MPAGIFLSALFLILNDINITRYADGNTLNKACDSVDVVVIILRMSGEKLFNWFKEYQMKGNTD